MDFPPEEEWRTWLREVCSTNPSAVGRLALLFGRLADEQDAAPIELREYAVFECDQYVEQFYERRMADSSLPPAGRLIAACELLVRSGRSCSGARGPKEFKDLIREALEDGDDEALQWLALLLKDACEHEFLWARWKPTVREFLPKLAKKVNVLLLKPPRKRDECRIIALAAYHGAGFRYASKLALRATDRMMDWRESLEEMPPELRQALDEAGWAPGGLEDGDDCSTTG